MAIAGLVPAIGSLLGSIGQGIFSAKSAKKAYERQRDLWTYEQTHAHQFEVQDLKAAGLNPILSATNSQIASMPSVQQERVPDNDLGMALTSALQSSIQAKSVENTYDIDKRKIGIEEQKIALERDRLKLQEQQSAANISYINSQRDMVLEQVKGYMIDNEYKGQLHEADLRTKDEMVRELNARANKLVQESGLVGLQKERLESEMKYGSFLIKYCPARLLDKVISKFDSILDREDFNDYIDNIASGTSVESAVKDYIEELARKGTLSD